MDSQMKEPEEKPTEYTKSSSTVWQLLYLLMKWKWFILVYFVATMIAVTVVILLIPRSYKAEASVLPPTQSELSNLGGISSMLQNIGPLLGKTGLGSGAQTYTYLAILNSRTVMDSVIKKFDLVKVYKITQDTLYMAEKKLRGNSNFDLDQNNAIDISVYDRSPVRAAEMANYFVTLLNKIFVRVSVEEAKNNAIFMKQRYEKNVADLKEAGDTLQAFQEHYGVYDMPAQAKAAITAGADLEAQKIAAQVELGVFQQQFGSGTPQVRLKELQIEELQKKLDQMRNGGGNNIAGGGGVLPAFKNVPRLGIEYLRLYTNLEIQSKLLGFIAPMYEQAKIEEEKSTPAVIVLDKAIVPERPATPKRVFIELIFAIVVFSFLVYIIHVLERVRHPKDPLNPLEERVRNFADKSARRFRVKEHNS